MTIDSTLNIASMMQSYRQLKAIKQDTNNEEIAFDSANADNAVAQTQSNLDSTIAEMKRAWVRDSKRVFTPSEWESAAESFSGYELRLIVENGLSKYFGYNSESFKDSISVGGSARISNLNQPVQNNLEQNPRYANAMNYRYDVIDQGEMREIIGNPEYWNVQISVFHSPTDREISIVDKGYSRADFDTAANTIEKMLDSVLKEQFEQDPNSQETNILLLLKAKLQAMPEIIEQIRGNATAYARKAIEEDKQKALEAVIDIASMEIENELRIFHDIGVKLKQYLTPEQQEQFAELKDTIINYYQNNWNRDFAFKGFDPVMQYALSEATKALNENIKNIAIEDNTETLLNLSAEKSTDYASIVNDEAARESVLSRAKKVSGDDSLLQKLMSSKTTNQAKVAEASV